MHTMYQVSLFQTITVCVSEIRRGIEVGLAHVH